MPAFTRLAVDERRRRLLELGADLFTRHAYDDLTMATIAREAGISKGLLYHYFPSKQAFFAETLNEAARELAALVRPDPELPPAQALAESLDAYLRWVEAHADAYAKVMRSVSSVAEVRDLVDVVRADTANTILERLHAGGPPPPILRTAVTAWLWFADGAILDWLAHRDLDRAALRDVLMRALWGATGAPGGLS